MTEAKRLMGLCSQGERALGDGRQWRERRQGDGNCSPEGLPSPVGRPGRVAWAPTSSIAPRPSSPLRCAAGTRANSRPLLR